MKLDLWLSQAQQGLLLPIPALLSVCQQLEHVFAQESNLLSIAAPVHICGDVHGQFDDLNELFKLHGACPDRTYLFLGDYVDRGLQSVETMVYLLLLKLKYPRHVFLLRGNHESRQTTQIYGFYTECQQKYEGDSRIYQAFMNVFDCFPIGAVVQDQQLNIHGGLSPNFMALDQLRVFDRFQEIPTTGALSDLVWSDPDRTLQGFHVSPRGAGFLFGSDILEKFLHLNNLTHLSRAHQLCMEGYESLFRDTLTTIWSAPNYCYRFGNSAAVMTVNEQLVREFSVFQAATTSAQNHKSLHAAVNIKSMDEGYFT